MYTVKIDISDWCNDEFITIETNDFDKVQIIQEFIELQKDYGWAVDYDVVIAEDEEVNGIEEDDEPSTISTYVITKIEE